MGFSSYAFRWFFGYSISGEAPPVVLCPCPEYGHDATLVNNFTNIQTLVNEFMHDGTLSNQFSNEASLSNQFNSDATIVTQWKRGPCNG